ncbi:MAG: L-threonylcarbamoyladenylate synthase [Bacteroidales bacterium]|nr:L-threonylcarbamoyladenylate synthase [Bacteroidales bacterium]
MKAYSNIIREALDILRNGGVILYPTDTVWGLGCDATNTDAVRKIYRIKQRADEKSMLILLDTESRLLYYVKQVPEIAYQLTEVSDRPITIIYPGARNISPELTAADGSAGIRITDDEFCSDLIARLGKPLVSSSANISGEQPPGFFDEISDIIKESVDYIVPLRQDEITRNKPSSIIKIEIDGQFKIIR